MARINLPLTDVSIVEQQQTPAYNTQNITQAAAATSQGYSQLLDRSLGQADRLRNQAFSAEMAAVEAENAASLGKLIPEAMGKIGKIMTETGNTLAAIDQKEYEENLRKQENAYMMENVMKMQEDYLYFRDEMHSNPTSDAPKKVSKWFEGRMSDILKKAPSEDAKLEMTQKLLSLRLHGLEDGFGIRQRALKAEREQALMNAMNSAVSAAYVDPSSPEAAIATVDKIGEVFGQEGMPEPQRQTLINQTKGNIINSSVTAHLENGNISGALDVFRKPALQTLLDPSKRQELGTNIAKSLLLRNTNSSKKIDTALGQIAFMQNQTIPGVSNNNQIADNVFLSYIQNSGNPQALNGDTYRRWADDTTKFFNTYNQVMGPQTMKMLGFAVQSSNNPHYAAASALVIDGIMNNPQSPARNLAPQLAKSMSDDQLAMALNLARSVKYGEPVEMAVANAKKNMRESLSPDAIADRKMQVKEAFKNMTPKDLANEAVGTSWYKFDVDAKNALPIAEEYKNLVADTYSKTGDMETARTIAASKMQKKYAVTEVNGYPEIMAGAPSLVGYKDEDVKMALDKQLSQFATSIGGEFKPETRELIRTKNGQQVVSKMRIEPVYERTEYETGKKTFLIVDDNTGRYVMNPNGTFKTFEYGLDEKAVQELRKKSIEKHSREYEESIKGQVEKLGIPLEKEKAVITEMLKRDPQVKQMKLDHSISQTNIDFYKQKGYTNTIDSPQEGK